MAKAVDFTLLKTPKNFQLTLQAGGSLLPNQTYYYMLVAVDLTKIYTNRYYPSHFGQSIPTQILSITTDAVNKQILISWDDTGEGDSDAATGFFGYAIYKETTLERLLDDWWRGRMLFPLDNADNLGPGETSFIDDGTYPTSKMTIRSHFVRMRCAGCIETSGGTDVDPSTPEEMYQADIAGSIDVLEAATPAVGMECERPILSGAGPIRVKITLAGGTAGAGDTIDITGLNEDGTTFVETIDVAAGNGDYWTTIEYVRINNIDCNGWVDGTIAILQDRWNVVKRHEDFHDAKWLYKYEFFTCVSLGKFDGTVDYWGTNSLYCPVLIFNFDVSCRYLSTVHLGIKSGTEYAYYGVHVIYNTHIIFNGLWGVRYFQNGGRGYIKCYDCSLTNLHYYDSMHTDTYNQEFEYIGCTFQGWQQAAFSVTLNGIIRHCKVTGVQYMSANVHSDTSNYTIDDLSVTTINSYPIKSSGYPNRDRTVRLSNLGVYSVNQTCNFRYGASYDDDDSKYEFVNPVLYDPPNFHWVFATNIRVNTGMTLRIYFELDLTVTNSLGTALSGAQVDITDVDGNSVYSGSTDESGEIPTQTLLRYQARCHGDWPEARVFPVDTCPPNEDIKTYTPHIITIQKDGYRTYTKKFSLNEKFDWRIALEIFTPESPITATLSTISLTAGLGGG